MTPAKRYCAALYVRNLFQQPTVAVVCAADAGRLSADTPLRLQINSAEQIVVPPDLGDVVKAYTKEVIRRQPKDLLEFSAVYFSNLANVSRNADDGPAPSAEQLAAAYRELASTEMIAQEDLAAVCAAQGVSPQTLEKVSRLADLAEMVDPKEFLVLMLTLTAEHFQGMLQSLFEVFGSGEGRLSTELFLTLFGFLAMRDAEISASFSDELAEDLAAKGVTELSFPELVTNPLIAQLCEHLG